MKKIKVLRTLKFDVEGKDVKGMGIPAGTVVGVVKEAPEHPTYKYRMLIVRIDNGARLDTDPTRPAWELCPETCIVVNQKDKPTTIEAEMKKGANKK